MAFEQELRLYLEGLEHGSPVEVEVPARHIDEHELHRHLLERLRELENGQWSSLGPALSPAMRVATVKQLFDDWSGKLAPLARYLEALPGQLVPIDPDAAKSFACRALDQAIDHADPCLPLADRLELQRAVEEFVRADTKVETYALENQLVRSDRPRRARLTEIGSVLLRLRGKDRVRWLLTNEVLQSTSAIDEWHAPLSLLEDAMSVQGIARRFSQGEAYYPYSVQTLQRLYDLDVLSVRVDSDDDVYQYSANAMMRDVIQAVLEPGPWHTAIRALLEDERAVALPGLAVSAAETSIEQTKLIAHEVRNALIPVRHDIDALRSLALEPAHQRRIEDVRGGVVRVLDFIEAMVQASEVITEPSTRCELGAVVSEALSWIDTEQRVQRLPPREPIYLQAPRVRLARALSNIIGNALQATIAAQPVRLSIERAGGVARVVVDDGGPGVPIEHREHIFLEGVTMRRDGTGSGFGLAFARRVVEGALHGKIWCGDSDLGGARFVIEVPEASP